MSVWTLSNRHFSLRGSIGTLRGAARVLHGIRQSNGVGGPTIPTVSWKRWKGLAETCLAIRGRASSETRGVIQQSLLPKTHGSLHHIAEEHYPLHQLGIQDGLGISQRRGGRSLLFDFLWKLRALGFLQSALIYDLVPDREGRPEDPNTVSIVGSFSMARIERGLLDEGTVGWNFERGKAVSKEASSPRTSIVAELPASRGPLGFPQIPLALPVPLPSRSTLVFASGLHQL
mmetsp:Transcript_80303/g.126741  ORF Transcript_80303/g.126741 Transcript_80303/m.126741 type:complete len:231 (+) Transcript_80303:230-922(+)